MSAPDPIKTPSAPLALTASLPLVLDLDGTLLRTDSLMETLVAYLRENPLRVITVLWWLLHGRPHLKRQLAQRATYDSASWPQNDELVAYAAAQAAAGRTVVLATATDSHIADAMRARFPFLAETLASDGATNLKSRAKARALQARFPGGFVYAGDSSADFNVWRSAAGAVLAGRSRGLAAAAAKLAPIETEFFAQGPSLKVWIKALRLHQWAKNALIFLPLFLGGETTNPVAWMACITCFFAMGLLASSTYLLNDLVDLESDRRHWSKQRRPLAAGVLPLTFAMAAAPVGVAAGLALGYWAGGLPGLALLLVYLVITLAYSFAMKRVPILDAVTLAGLFTIRIGLGVIYAQVAPSEHLFLFSMLLFTSLSLAKRATELGRMAERGHERVPGRGYIAKDLPTVAGFGAAAAVGACLVLSTYIITSAAAQPFYVRPNFLWVLPVLLGIWLGRVWLLCGRGELADDPVAFAVRDPISIALGAGMFVAFAIAAAGVPG